ncbi:hypothetical protein BKA62DRAFT_654287 [Auriculariales sp. MPI-PUGE-AT-0066]|nr:hypothetical protein BKA62DRAFT_654287 [Auriculariales sp. MPI-PUGE-AT-0066]
MSVTRFNVQLSAALPPSAQSFLVSVPSSSTVLELKERIAETCPGRPDASGQRVIWKGRIIDNTVIIGDVWNAEQEHAIHLSVNPTAWRDPLPVVRSPSEPITAASRPQTMPGLAAPRVYAPHLNAANLGYPSFPSPPSFSPAPPPYSMAFIHHVHSNALRVLSRLPAAPWWGVAHNDVASAKAASRQALEVGGATWPTILDEDYPRGLPGESQSDGAVYAVGFQDSLPYLYLQTPDAVPTTAQFHAIRVLQATMPLLDQAPFLQAQLTQQLTAAVQASLLSRAALAIPVVARPPRPAAAAFGLPAALQPLAQVQMRAVIVPLLVLAFRAGLLLYIFAPSRRPLFAGMIGAWVAWEVYTVFRAAMPADAAARAARARPAANGAAAPPGAAGAAPAQAGAATANGDAVNGTVVPPAPTGPARLAFAPDEPGQDPLARLAHFDLENEAALLEPGATPAQAPRLQQRVKSFFTLFVLSLHPAWWERRRRALRNREGQLRTRYRQPDPPVPVETGQQQPEGQPPREPPPQPPAGWAASYVERVRETEWIDE